ncbi:MAG: hypothetical protein ACYC3I_07100 [Gemmataceae bacterium]
MSVLLIVVATAMALGRVLSAELVYEPSLFQIWPNDPEHPHRAWPAKAPRPMPTFNSNDRSRWAAVRALVEEGTWVVGRHDPKTGKDSGIIFEDGWQSVDKMRDPATLEYYSTKPPLLTFLVACEYWLLKKSFGWSLNDDSRFAVVRVCLLTFNLLPFAVYLWLLVRLLERWGTTDWGRIFVVAAACFGTLMTPFLISLNNHTLAACSVVVAVYAAVRILTSPSPLPSPPTGGEGIQIIPSPLTGREGIQIIPSPLTGGEGIQIIPSPPVGGEGRVRGAWVWFVLAGFFAGFTAANELPAASFAAGLALLLLVRFPRRTLMAYAPAALVPVAALLALNYAELGEFNVGYSKFNTEWYQYEGSHWRNVSDQSKRGIDAAKEDKGTYAFHLFLGHHGWFSLTPIYLLALGGMGLGFWRLIGARSVSEGPSALANASGSDGAASRQWAELACATALLSLVVMAYYIYISNNYGGWSNGPRWLMWLSPLWLLTLPPIVERLGQRRWGRALCLALLALSVLSAHYWDWNPWRHPWIYNWMDSRGWIPY